MRAGIGLLHRLRGGLHTSRIPAGSRANRMGGDSTGPGDHPGAGRRQVPGIPRRTGGPAGRHAECGSRRQWRAVHLRRQNRPQQLPLLLLGGGIRCQLLRVGAVEPGIGPYRQGSDSPSSSHRQGIRCVGDPGGVRAWDGVERHGGAHHRSGEGDVQQALPAGEWVGCRIHRVRPRADVGIPAGHDEARQHSAGKRLQQRTWHILRDHQRGPSVSGTCLVCAGDAEHRRLPGDKLTENSGGRSGSGASGGVRRGSSLGAGHAARGHDAGGLLGYSPEPRLLQRRRRLHQRRRGQRVQLQRFPVVRRRRGDRSTPDGRKPRSQQLRLQRG